MPKSKPRNLSGEAWKRQRDEAQTRQTNDWLRHEGVDLNEYTLRARGRADVPSNPTGASEEDSLTVRGDPMPEGEDSGKSQAPEGSVIWRGIGPNGRPCIVIEAGERVKHWIYESHLQERSLSRGREWIFEGPKGEVDQLKRRLRLTHTYFDSWLRKARSRMSEPMMVRAVNIAEWFIAESSPWLIYRGRVLTPSQYGAVPVREGKRKLRLRRIKRKRHGKAYSARTRHGVAVSLTAAAFRIKPATVRRIVRDLRAFGQSTLFREKTVRYDSLGENTHLL